MGSGGGNGGGNDDKVASEPTKAGDSIAGKAAGQRTDTRKPKPGVRKREEERLSRAGFVSGDASYVRETPKEGERRGTIIRDSKGRGVLTAKGVERQEASRQEELETVIAARAVPTVEPDGTITTRQDPRAEKRKMALEIIDDKLKTAINPISIINLKNQKKRLEEGTADPLFQLTEGGSFTTQGVVDADDEDFGGNIPPAIPPVDPSEERAEQPQAPVIDDEDDDEEEQTILGRGRGAAQKRRTRGTRVGGAGTFETGYGVLLRGPRATQPGSGRLS